MRIAILASEFYPPYGGVGIYTQQLVKELCKKKHEVHVFTVERVPKKEVLDFFDNKIKLHYLCKANDDFVYNIKFQVSLFLKFMDYDKKYNYDIIHSMNLVHMPDIFLKLRLKKPVIVTAHTSISGQVNGFLKSNKNFFKMAPSEKGSVLAYPLIAGLEWIYLKKTKTMITVSNKFVDYFKAKGYEGEIVAIHNGVDTKVFNLSVKQHPVAKKKGVKVLFAGRLITQKGIEVFVKAMSKLLDEDVHFVVAGKGGVKQFKQLLKDYKIPASKVTFLGFIPNHELPAVYNACDIFVLPSFYENFPISLLEAMSMKCACVSTDVGAVDEIIDSGKNGFIVKAGDVDAFTEKVRLLVKDKQLRERLALAGYKKVVTSFTTEEMAKKTVEVYNLDGN